MAIKKKTWIILGAVAVALVMIVALFIGGYNSLVDMEVAVESRQADIQTQLQRRADLIPNFVETVKDYAAYEQETYQAITQARAAVTAANTPGEQAAASDQLDRAIDIWVNAVTEAYPTLVAGDQYRALQDELAGSENRIAVARKDYNETVKTYNAAIRRFPKSLLAGLFGFERAEFFEADADALDVPDASTRD